MSNILSLSFYGRSVPENSGGVVTMVTFPLVIMGDDITLFVHCVEQLSLYSLQTTITFNMNKVLMSEIISFTGIWYSYSEFN